MAACMGTPSVSMECAVLEFMYGWWKTTSTHGVLL
eukprot:CAMPEP_0181311228 /NCGR_PEP_ID=MMETSP1101-20121128/13021_1 /TAXON_ID=46948 /ORGANISM="Rhodomonas abbreviata, Strain Caron Lab Isolate" /LENGTH=34 /DNA_ID= /DNA_START= /DNA_END= /DNA_ORIENTATION=